MIFYSWSAAQKRVLLPPRQQVFWFNFNCWLDIYHKTPWSVESRHLLPTQLHLQQRRVKKLVKLSGRIFIVCWITNWKKNLLKILSVMVTSNLIESCTVIYKKKLTRKPWQRLSTRIKASSWTYSSITLRPLVGFLVRFI